jgi:hypothetical protein
MRRWGLVSLTLCVLGAGCASSASPPFVAKAPPGVGGSAGGPLVVDGASHVVIMEYEAWFGPKAVGFPPRGTSPRPLLQSADMQALGGGYDSADPAVIQNHVALLASLGVDAAIVELTNNVSCIFDSGPDALNPQLLNPCGQSDAGFNRQFQTQNRQIRDNDANIYAAWSALGTSLKIVPLLACQDNGCLTPYSASGSPAGFGADPCPAIPGQPHGNLGGNPAVEGTTSFEKEMAFYGDLMARYPNASVLYGGKPLVLVFVPPPTDDGHCMMGGLQKLLAATGLDSKYTFRMMGGYFDTDQTFWSEPGRTPHGPVALGPGFGALWWSWVDRLNKKFAEYPSYTRSPLYGRAENLTVSIATAGQDGWGSYPAACRNAPSKRAPFSDCQRGTDYYIDSSLRDQGGRPYSTLAQFMGYAAQLDPLFLIVHQFNEFATPDEGWDAETTDDIEPADDGIGSGAVDAVRSQIQQYRARVAR